MDKNDDILMDGIDERIEAFLRGEMTVEEENSFKQELRENPELRSHAMTMTSLIRGLQAHNREKEQTIIQKNRAKSSIRPIIIWASSIAAMLVIVFGIGLFNNNRRSSLIEETISPYYGQYDINNTIRGDIDSVAIARLYSLFNKIQEQKDMSSIISELEPIYHSLDTDFTYYTWANDIAWNLALAYAKDDQIDKAISILQKLKADNPDTPIYIKADELIKKLQDL